MTVSNSFCSSMIGDSSWSASISQIDFYLHIIAKPSRDVLLPPKIGRAVWRQYTSTVGRNMTLSLISLR